MSTPNPCGGSGSARVVTLISTGHFLSHFYMLLLPPLFPLLREVYGVGFTELGLALTVFSITTGLTQAPVGFLVDRWGARAILISGLLLESLAIGLIGVFPLYGALVALMVLAGLANAVYHPADYAILSASVAERRMGRAFSIHTFAGYLGSAVAPVTMVWLMTLTDWRTALVLCGAAGGGVAVLMAINSGVLHDAARRGREAGAGAGGSGRSGMALLLSTPMLLGLLFFTGISVTYHGIGNFSVSVLNLSFGAPLAQAGAVLSVYLFAAPVGVLAGGWLADRTTRHDEVAAVCFLVIGAAVLSVAAFHPSLAAVAAIFCIGGFFNGLVAPSRDMMIRAITPQREMGKVFGFVSTGYNIGGIVAPAMFGWLLDHSAPVSVFWATGVVGLLSVGAALAARARSRRQRARLASQPDTA